MGCICFSAELGVKGRLQYISEWKATCVMILDTVLVDEMETNSRFVKIGGGRRALEKKLKVLKHILEFETRDALKSVYKEAVDWEIQVFVLKDENAAKKKRQLQDTP